MGRKRLTVAVAEELKKVLFTPTGKGRGKEGKKVARSGGKKRVKEVDSEGRGSGAGVGFLKLSTGAENFSAVEGEIVDNLSTLTEKISAVKPEIVDNLKYWVLVNMALNQSVFGKTSTVVILFTIINLYFLRGEVSVSQEELGKITGLTDRTVRDSLKSLKLRGFIEVNYRRNAKAGESYSYKPVFERILEVMGKGGMLGDGRFRDYLKVLGVPKLSTGAENFSAVEPKNVDNLSTLAEFFSSVNLKNVDNSLKYAYLTEVINNQSVFGSALGVALFLALLSLEFTRGVINVSQAELEAFTGISERSIRKILREFEDRGILAVDRRRNTKVGGEFGV
jgi:transcription initiation factor IIE alpha subunit